MYEKVILGEKKKLVLVVDDEFINREIMGEILKDHYEVIYAENGKDAINKIKDYKDDLSLILLDLMMPLMTGIDVLNTVKEDKDISKIPVIVITSDRESEVDSLGHGAVDFIPKPFPDQNVILARVKRTIELFEDRATIKSTERDQITKLYALEYFYRYCKDLDKNTNFDMDAIIVDIHHFHIINNKYGMEIGDKILREFSLNIKKVIHALGGIVSRKDVDKFMLYVPHRDSYSEILEKFLQIDVKELKNPLILKMGIYPHVDKSLDITKRFERATIACETIKNMITESSIAIFNKELYEKELFDEKLIDDFEVAIREKQFKVYYQPKFNIQCEKPVITSAEALLRWIHPTLGFISPGVFIPVFENSGLIQRMDNYVWNEAAKKIKEFKQKYNINLPISVNVSRANMFDSDITKVFEEITKNNEIDNSELLLEITESAYTDNESQMISNINALREKGFRIEMDDFGAGYSSLNLITLLPIDVLKIDMALVRNAFSDKKNIRMLEIIMDIKKYLNVQSVAEGVETIEQVNVLKELGCDIIQGYYFSKPLNESDFEEFVKKEFNIK